MRKAYFQYYETFENIVQKFKDIEDREYMRNIIIRYGLYGEIPTFIKNSDPLEEMMELAFCIAKELIDDQVHRREINAENRRIKQKQKEAEQAKTTKRFEKPTVKEIAAYCEERHNGINAQQFFNFYESKGWKVGSVAMKDWKACVRTWEQRHSTFSKDTNGDFSEDKLML